MNEPRGRRPRKHLQNEHHLQTSDDTSDLVDEVVVENPTQEDVVVADTLSVQSTIEESSELSEAHSTDSPVEQKIEKLVADAADAAKLDGWHPFIEDSVLDKPPLNGMTVRLSDEPKDKGVLGFWKKIRAFANTTKRWEKTGAWYDLNTGMKLPFVPKFWKERF